MPNNAEEIESEVLAEYLRKSKKSGSISKFIIVDCRNFIDYNNAHVQTAINAFYSKIMRRRLLNNQTCSEFILNHLSHGLGDKLLVCDKIDLILYAGEDSSPKSPQINDKEPSFKCHCAELQNEKSGEENNICTRCRSSSSPERFIRFLFEKLKYSKKLKFKRIMLLKDGFLTFYKTFPELCDSQLRDPLKYVSGRCTENVRTSSSSNYSTPFQFKIDPIFNQQNMGLKQQPPLLLRCRRRGVDDSELSHEGTNSKGLPLPLSISQPCLASQSEDEKGSWRTYCPTPSNEYKILPATQILDFMFLGCASDALNTEFLKKNGITKVINLSEDCAKPSCLPDDEEHFLRIPIKDSYQSRLIPHFEEAFKFIDNAKRSGDKVLVHCLAGISRSPTLAMAYIMRDKKLRSFEAFDYVKSYRPSICPNLNFMGQLLFYEMHLRDQAILPPLELNEENEQNRFIERKNDSTPTSDSLSNRSSSIESTSGTETNNNNDNDSPVMRQNLINVNGKRTMDKPLALPDRPRPSMINFNMSCDRRSCPVGFGLSCAKQQQQQLTTKTIPPIDTPSPSNEFSRLDISLAAQQQQQQQTSSSSIPSLKNNNKQNSNEAINFFENPMFGKTKPIETSDKSIQSSPIYASTAVSNPMFNGDFKAVKSSPILCSNREMPSKSKINKNLFLRHILPQCVENCAEKKPTNFDESPSKKTKKFKKLHCGNFLSPDKLRFKCLLATKVKILPTVVDSNEPEPSVSDSASMLTTMNTNNKSMNKNDDDNVEEEYYSFDEADNDDEKNIKFLEGSRKNNCMSQISDSQESGYTEDFNASDESSSTRNFFEDKHDFVEPV